MLSERSWCDEGTGAGGVEPLFAGACPAAGEWGWRDDAAARCMVEGVTMAARLPTGSAHRNCSDPRLRRRQRVLISTGLARSRRLSDPTRCGMPPDRNAGYCFG